MLILPQKLFQLGYQSDFVTSRLYFFPNKAKFLFLDMFRITVISRRNRQTDLLATYLDGWNTVGTVIRFEGTKTIDFPLRIYSDSPWEELFVFSASVFISIIGVSVSQWNESIYVNGVQRRGRRTLREKSKSRSVLFIFLLFIDIPLLISPRLPFLVHIFAHGPFHYPNSGRNFKNWKFHFI